MKYDLFEICNECFGHYIYAKAFVKVESEKITEVEYASIHLAWYCEEQFETELKQFEVCEGLKDGWYDLNLLASIKYDDNGVGHTWSYLECENWEILFKVSIEEMEQTLDDVDDELPFI